MIDVLLLGSTNVGKSTLFNLLVEKRQALVADIEGLTKDWDSGVCVLDDRMLLKIVDTPGVVYRKLSDELGEPWYSLINKSRLICIVVDGTQNLTHFDEKIAHDLRILNKPYVVLVNKMDKARASKNFTEFFALSGDKTVGITAIRKQTRSKLCALFSEYLTQDQDVQLVHKPNIDKDKIQLVILGKPNSGKSSLVNYLLGYERMLVSEVAGTTHNAVTVDYAWQDKTFSITDTAGIRRRTKIEEGIESVTTKQSWKVAKQAAEILILLVDVVTGITKQDWVLIDQILAMHKPIIICYNKIDLLSSQDCGRLSRVKYIKLFRVSYISSTMGAGVKSLLRQINVIYQTWMTPIKTSLLNRWLKECTNQLSPPYVNGKRLKLKYAVQINVTSPTFLIFSNDAIPQNYLSYLQGSLCREFELWSIPIKIECRYPDQRK